VATGLVAPHGGELRPLILEGPALTDAVEAAGSLKEVRLSTRETSDLVMMAMGAFSPLRGFMGREDYEGVVRGMHMADGTLWPMPITLSIPEDKANSISIGEEVALVDDDSGFLMGSMAVEEKFTYDKRNEALSVFGTEDEEHPGVARVYAQHEVLIAGPVKAFSEGPYPDQHGDFYGRPAETRSIFEQKHWNTVAAFQTGNPIHRSHEYCTKIALEIADGLLINPLAGKWKADDIPTETRMRCYEVLLDHYYPADRVVLKVCPMEMRYGGPREAVLHAVFRQNYGCSHLVIGRDHAGVGNCYGPLDSQKIFDDIDPDDLHIKPLKIDRTFWCYRCDGMSSMKTCTHDARDQLLMSDAELHEMLSAGERSSAGLKS